MSQRFQGRRELTEQDLGKGLQGGQAAYRQSKAAGGQGSGTRGQPRTSSEEALFIQVFAPDPEGSRDHQSVLGRERHGAGDVRCGCSELRSPGLPGLDHRYQSLQGRKAGQGGGPLLDVLPCGGGRQHGTGTRRAGASRRGAARRWPPRGGPQGVAHSSGVSGLPTQEDTGPESGSQQGRAWVLALT